MTGYIKNWMPVEAKNQSVLKKPKKARRGSRIDFSKIKEKAEQVNKPPFLLNEEDFKRIFG